MKRILLLAIVPLILLALPVHASASVQSHQPGLTAAAPTPPLPPTAPRFSAGTVPGPTPYCNPFTEKCPNMRVLGQQAPDGDAHGPAMAAMILFGPGIPSPPPNGTCGYWQPTNWAYTIYGIPIPIAWVWVSTGPCFS